MPLDILQVGADWLAEKVGELTEQIERVSPSEFSEMHRYIPSSVSPHPGPMTWDFNPYMREIVDCFDVDSPMREINVMKGVKVTYSTALDSVILYFAAHVRTLPVMYMTAEKELADARIEIDIIQMFNQSGFKDLIRSSDEDNNRKTGKTKHHLQWGPEGYLVPFGAKNAAKMRQFSVAVLLKDEFDGWPDVVGKDGDPDKLSDARTDGYSEQRKIGRGSTPLTYPSKIEKQYLRGDQRKYMVKCLSCGFPQELRWSGTNDKGEEFGIFWNHNDDGQVDQKSVRYVCVECGHAHHEHDKVKLFSPEFGAQWVPTATPVAPHIRSYHLSGMYSMTKTWYEQILLYLEGWDPENARVRDITKFQVFYNNVLGLPFQVFGTKVSRQAAYSHRRTWYNMGMIPNNHAKMYSGGEILFLTCTVDVHKSFLAVAVIGWCRDARSYLIEYLRWDDDGETGCESPESPVWSKLQKLIEEKVYVADNGRHYNIELTLIDSGFAASTVYTFCSEYASSVLPIKGVPTVGRQQRPKAFWDFKTQTGAVGFNISVDHYKDRLAPVLRRDWEESQGRQDKYHFNAPIDITDKQLDELTVERRQNKTDERGRVTQEWYRPGNARNELWDLMVYAHAAVEMIAYEVCKEEHGLDAVDWDLFWDTMAFEKA